ncbi:hypothetical protein GTA08_BOTSDO09120 [Neofusicoccum parvum]|uniref:Uncharacterized protein n=1 Tax=Neofusicoccum parvum TaxID=310453 RepID=A0ACB5SMJ8_9PEZI|nr:hypothetical protein GTA08_BOTSDO09120 [Neofusicoccum parvum]
MSTTAASQQTSSSTSASAAASTTLATSTTRSSSSGTSSSPAATTVALTTTFTPPASCTEKRFSMLSSPWWNIWLNEPSPVPGSLVTDCYPTQWIDGYTSVFNMTSSIAPVMSPLVCPDAWSIVRTYASLDNYIACCPSGFGLHEPSTTVDASRPAYGGTCYTTFTDGQTIEVTAYNASTLTATQPFTATSGDQAYAHVIDGYALAEALSTPSSSTSSTASAATTIASASAAATTSSTSSSNKISGGAIAGIVIGVIAFVALLFGLALFFFRRRRAQRQASAVPPNEYGSTGNFHETHGDSAFPKEMPGRITPSNVELEGPGPVMELEARGPVELDATEREKRPLR